MVVTSWLIDKSALVRLAGSPDAADWAAKIERVYLTPAIEDRAVEVQLALAERGHHRAASIPDLLIAATAEQARLTVLHVDRDFELIADVTGQPVERLVGR